MVFPLFSLIDNLYGIDNMKDMAFGISVGYNKLMTAPAYCFAHKFMLYKDTVLQPFLQGG